VGSITNDSPKATITIASFSVVPPWADKDIEALPDPKQVVPESDRYTVYGSYIDHPREWTLNHLRFQHGRLQPGDTIRGTFLAKGSNPIPTDLRKNEAIVVEFVVKDTKGNVYKQKMRVFPECVAMTV
jgi:hypothetical protein